MPPRFPGELLASSEDQSNEARGFKLIKVARGECWEEHDISEVFSKDNDFQGCCVVFSCEFLDHKAYHSPIQRNNLRILVLFFWFLYFNPGCYQNPVSVHNNLFISIKWTGFKPSLSTVIMFWQDPINTYEYLIWIIHCYKLLFFFEKVEKPTATFFIPRQQNAIISLHNIDFGVFWASWGESV